MTLSSPITQSSLFIAALESLTISVAFIMMFSYGNKKVTKTEVGTRERGIAMIGLAMLLVGGSLMGHTTRNREDSSAKSNLSYDDLAQEVSEKIIVSD